MNKYARKDQERVNSDVIRYMQKNNDEIYNLKGKSVQLRHCSAVVYETDNLYVLRSYSTIVAVIDKTTDTLYDFLRYVYGYTATSAQHIAKFKHDYGASKFGTAHELHYHPI